MKYLIIFILSISSFSQAEECGHMMSFDPSMQMCMPYAMPGMSMSMFMLQGNAFLTGISESGPRGRSIFSLPNFVMTDIGTSVSEHHYLNLEFMGTLERWTTPDQGYPELLQIGEENSQGISYLDAQHPHSSPVMGLTLSDTISLSGKNHLKLFFAPRGQATDGPIAFMHRPTGEVNPDAPLGHHIGQDVGHITSTVLGESLKLGSSQIELSTYHGAEPKPQQVDLPLGGLDSYSFRWIQEWSDKFTAMASYAYVLSEMRYSASIYNQFDIDEHWQFVHAFIWGAISNHDQTSTLVSFTDEFLFKNNSTKIWGRIEALERTPNELQISTSLDAGKGLWVEALTLGYTRELADWRELKMSLGGSLTTDFLPQAFQSAYGGNNPFTAKIFLQLNGMQMSHF